MMRLSYIKILLIKPLLRKIEFGNKRRRNGERDKISVSLFNTTRFFAEILNIGKTLYIVTYISILPYLAERRGERGGGEVSSLTPYSLSS